MEELTRIREELGWTQQRLADESDVNKATINQIERGRRSPNVETLEKLVGAMGREIGDLFPKAQASLPFDNGPGQRRPIYLASWSDTMSEISGDMEEWRLGWGDEPADLPEQEFLLYVGGVGAWVQVYRRISRSVYEELAPTLKAEPAIRSVAREIERFERAFRRLSKAMGSMLTQATEQRIGRMDQKEKASKQMQSNIRVLRESKTA